MSIKKEKKKKKEGRKSRNKITWNTVHKIRRGTEEGIIRGNAGT